MRIQQSLWRRILAFLAILAGVIILLFIIPFWVWLAMIGVALIVTGLLIFLRRC